MKIYINIPAGAVAGGVESLYQLADGIRTIGKESYVVFDNNTPDPIPEKYKHYNIHISSEIEDAPNNWIIYPEVWTNKLHYYNHIQKAIWWLSVDNNQDQFTDWSNDSILHLYQSYYAFSHILNKGGSYYLPLFDYINNKYSICTKLITNKQDIICYNPAKGKEITEGIIRSNPDLSFIPLVNMDESQIIETLTLSKVYIDFGHHPGRDRIPREAALLNNCVITSFQGSCMFYNDVPIKNKYKLDSYERVGALIKECLSNFDNNIQEFQLYQNFINNQYNQTLNQIQQIF